MFGRRKREAERAPASDPWSWKDGWCTYSGVDFVVTDEGGRVIIRANGEKGEELLKLDLVPSAAMKLAEDLLHRARLVRGDLSTAVPTTNPALEPMKEEA
jgi:hypothetical protein